MLPQEEHLYKRKKGQSLFKLFMRPEQRNIASMKNIVQSFTKPWNLDVDAYLCTFSVAKACLLLPKHKIVTGYEENARCVTEVMPQLILLYDRRLLSKKYDIDLEEEVRSSAEMHVKIVEAIELQKHLDVWEVSESLFTCRCSRHICNTM